MQRLKLKYDGPLSIFALNGELRRYGTDTTAPAACANTTANTAAAAAAATSDQGVKLITGRPDLAVSVELFENTYEKGPGAQELILSNLRITNNGPGPVMLRPAARGGVALNFSFDPTVGTKQTGWPRQKSRFKTPSVK